jgi:hypothetical protein
MTVAAAPPTTFVNAGLVLRGLADTRERAVAILRAFVEKS